MQRTRLVIATLLLALTGGFLVPQAVSAETHSQVELRPGETVTSPDGRFTLTHQGDGNVVLYGPDGAIWHTRTHGKNTDLLVFQDDGNLVLYDQGAAVWHTRTYGKGQALAVQNDANLVVYGSEKPVWAIKGMTPPTPPRDVRASTADGCGGWRHTVSYHFGSETTRACRVLMCESQGNRHADNPKSTASGLFQFLDSTWRSTTGTAPPAKAYSPDTQVRAAKMLRDAQGWSPWVCR